MVKINPSITLELKGGKMITIDLDEAHEVIKGLARFVQGGNGHAARKKSKNTRKGSTQMSEAKKAEIIKHVNKRLSSKPRTLSNLLKGISYVPNNLPAIRQLVEGQPRVSKRMIGKRMYYQRGSAQQQRVTKSAAAA